MVRWSDAFRVWEPAFVTRAELDAKMGDRAANHVWATERYSFAVKASGRWGMAPFTQAEAFAAWFNRRFSWDYCQRFWDELPFTGMDPRKIDDASRDQLKQRLKELVTV